MSGWVEYFSNWSDYSPAIRSIAQGILGVGAIVWFAYSVFRKVDVGRELDVEQKRDRSALRKRNTELEGTIAALQERIIEAEKSAAAYSATLATLHELIAEYRQRERNLDVMLRLAGMARDDALRHNLALQEQLREASGFGSVVTELQKTILRLEKESAETDRIKVLLHQVKFFLDGCSGCQSPAALRSIRRSLPRFLEIENDEAQDRGPSSNPSEGV